MPCLLLTPLLSHRFRASAGSGATTNNYYYYNYATTTTTTTITRRRASAGSGARSGACVCGGSAERWFTLPPALNTHIRTRCSYAHSPHTLSHMIFRLPPLPHCCRRPCCYVCVPALQQQHQIRKRNP